MDYVINRIFPFEEVIVYVTEYARLFCSKDSPKADYHISKQSVIFFLHEIMIKTDTACSVDKLACYFLRSSL